MRKIMIILFFFSSVLSHAQHLPVHPTHGVYNFLTELANQRILDISTVAIPYGHNQVAEWLDDIDVSELNERQLQELTFYKKEFFHRGPIKQSNAGTVPEMIKNGFMRAGPADRLDLYQHYDSLFTLVVNPIGGGDYYLNENGTAYHWWNGAEASATIGKWVIYGSLRDNHQSTWLTDPDRLNQNYGGANFKPTRDGPIDYWEYRGGVAYDFGIGNIGIYKDHFEWGNNYHGSNIFSGRTQSFAHVALNISPAKWLQFRWVHGWLVSHIIDSTRSFTYTNA